MAIAARDFNNINIASQTTIHLASDRACVRAVAEAARRTPCTHMCVLMQGHRGCHAAHT